MADFDVMAALRSPASMAELCSGGKWKPYRHLLALDQALMSLITGDTFDCLIVELPVRHGKSLLCSVWLPAWYLARWPTKTVGLAGHSADFVTKWGRMARQIIAEHGETFGLMLDPSSNAAARWDLAGHGGGMWTAGVGGGIIGKGYDLGIIDDPVKKIKEARSDVERENVWDWWQGVWLGREEPGAKRVIVMSRWHNDDLIGRLEDSPGGLRLRRLRLPAIAEEDDPMGRAEGEALCPERYTAEKLEAFRVSRGPYVFAAQYQQTPIAEGDQELNPELFGKFTYVDGGVQLDTGQRWAHQNLRTFTTVDLAMTTKSSADWSVAVTFSVTPEGIGLIRDVDRVRRSTEDHVSWLAQIHQRMRPQWIGIEDGLTGTATLQAAIRAGLPVRPLTPDGDKVARAQATKVMLVMRRLYYRDGAPWVDKFLREIGEFDKGRYDDQVDALSYGCGVILRGLRGKGRRTTEPTDAGVGHRAGFGTKPRRTLHPIAGRM